MTEDEMIHSDSEDQRWFTIVLNKAISSHKAKVAPEMLQESVCVDLSSPIT